MQISVKNTAYSLLDRSIQASGVGARLGLLQAKYLDMLESCGILEGIDLLAGIASCMQTVCIDTASIYSSKVSAYRTVLKVNSDGTINGSLFPSATAEQQSVIDAAANSITELESSISNWAIA